MLEQLIAAIGSGRVWFSRHSLQEAAADALSTDEVLVSVLRDAEVIEDYPEAFPLPACLVLGWSLEGEPIHTVWGYDRANQTARLVTVYRPDPERWIDWRTRR